MARGFLFDVNKCTGCHACRLACEVENNLPWGTSWRGVHGFNPENDPDLPLFHLSLACNHCDDAPCMSACPALAYRRDATGAVLIDENRCIGCKYCSWACPFDAPLFAADRGVMTKCTLCTPRLAENLDPACVSYCPTGALGFGEVDGATSSEDLDGAPGIAKLNGAPTGGKSAAASRRRDRIAPGFVDHGIGPRIRFTPLREDRWRSGDEGTPPQGDADQTIASRARRLSLRTEWPLLAFTLMAAVAVAIFSAAAFADRPAPLWAWLMPAAAGMTISLLHLGERMRAWRAVLNLRRSWVSREVFAFSMFIMLGMLASPAAGGVAWLTWPAAWAGFLALWAMDRVYTVTRLRDGDPMHSAEVLDTGLYLAAWLVGWPVLAGIIGLYKIVLYLRRKIRAARSGASWAPWWSTLRVVLGFAVPLGLALDRPDYWAPAAFASALAGEIIDRIEFYAGFRLASPGAALDEEHRRRADAVHSRRVEAGSPPGLENGQSHSPGV